MPTFQRDSFFNPEAGFSRIKFGKDAPLLELELNEQQKILLDNMRRFAENVIGNGILHVGTLTLNSGLLTVDNEVAVINGFVAMITSSNIAVTNGDTVYINFQEKEVLNTDTLKKYGNANGATITNQIADPELGVETSRRFQWVYKLTKNSGDAGTNLPLCTIGANNTFTRVKNTAPSLFNNELKNYVKKSTSGLTWDDLEG